MTKIALKERLRLWQEQGQYETMAEALLALGKDLDHELALWLAWVQNKREKFDDAIDVLLREEAAGEHDPYWHLELGKAYRALAQDDLAQTQFEQALKLDENLETAWQLLAECSQRSGVSSAMMGQMRPESRSAGRCILYTEEESITLREHILAYYGEYRIIHHNEGTDSYPVDIILIDPSEARPFYTLMTIGMGAYRMAVPEPLQVNKLDRAELMICLPQDWSLDEKNEEDDWAVLWLDALAYLPLEENSWLGWGHTVPADGPLTMETEQCAAILCNPCASPEEAAICPLPDGNEINFYQLIPIYEEELIYKMENSAEALFDRFGQVDHLVDLKRANTCLAWQDKQWAIAEEAMQPFLIDWKGPDQALATDRIIVEGMPVGYMYREEPVIGEETDSGWRFMAGDETEDYLSDPEHFGVYDLNVLCNYDPDILPHLTAPIGSAFYRDSSDEFQPDSRHYDVKSASFAQRTENFWQWFAYYEPLLCTIMDNAEAYRSEDVVAMISEGTDRLAGNVQFTLRGDRTFSFLADGVFCRFYLMPYVIACMPQELKERWAFFPWIQSTDWEEELPDQFIAWQDLYLSLEPAEEMGQFKIRFFHEHFLHIEEQQCYGSFFLLLEMLLGEAAVYMYISDAQKAQRIEETMFPLRELAHRLQAAILAEQVTIDTDPANHYTPYQRQPDDQAIPRFDVIHGETCYPELIIQYYQNQAISAGVIALYGAQAVYLSFAHDGTLSLDEQDMLRDELLRRLTEEILGVRNSGKELGIVLGGASGTKNCYVDLLLFDTLTFLSQVSNLLNEYPYTFYMAPFYQFAVPMVITTE